MENIEKETKNHPKPSEEVQMDIETVIPDTEKIIPPSAIPETIKEPKPQEPAVEEAPKEETEQGNDQEATESSNSQEEAGIDNLEDDARDAIETVSP